jgi:hypothetical protein
MPRTPKESLIRTLQVTQSQLDRTPPNQTKADKRNYEADRIKHVGLFNLHLDRAKALGLAVAASEWQQPFEDTGFGGLPQYLCTREEVAYRNRMLLELLEKTPDTANPGESDPTKPDPAGGAGAPSQ